MAAAKPLSLQTVWGWKIATYLFLAGAGAGAYLVGSAALLWPGLASPPAATLFMEVGAAAVAVSVLFLIGDLGRPRYFLRALLRPGRSWLARGSWILIAFCALAAATLLARTPQGLTAVSLALAVAVATYTGLLLGTMLARPLWNTPALPVLFLVSALSTGMALCLLFGMAFGMAPGVLGAAVASTGAVLRAPHIGLLALEMLVLYFYLSIAHGRSRDSVELLVRGRLALGFWGGVVGIGLVLPLALLAAEGGGESLIALEIVAECAVLVGGYLLRRLILAAGIRNPVHLGVPFVIRREV